MFQLNQEFEYHLFNCTGIDEEGIWRKSGNFSRIKRLQRELTILTNGVATSKKTDLTEKNQSKSSIRNAQSASSVSSIESSRSLSASTNSLDEIDDDDCDYSVHDMTVVVKRILIPEFLQDRTITAFLSLMDMLSHKVHTDVLKCPDEAVILNKFRDRDPRLYSNFVSCLSLFLLFHQKLNHSLFENESAGSRAADPITIFSSFMHLMAVTVENCQSNKMTASNMATLLLPLLYPSSTDNMLTTSPIDGGFRASGNRQHFMLSFVLKFWKQISSASSLPKTFVTDFTKLMEKSGKRKSSEVDNEQGDESNDENEVMSTCVRFAVNAGNPFAKTDGISETELELARLYAHVHASKDKRMIKKLNRAGVVIPTSAKKAKAASGTLSDANAVKTPAKTPSRSRITSLKSIFSSSKKKSAFKHPDVTPPSSSGDQTSDSEAASSRSNSFEVLRFN